MNLVRRIRRLARTRVTRVKSWPSQNDLGHLALMHAESILET